MVSGVRTVSGGGPAPDAGRTSPPSARSQHRSSRRSSTLDEPRKADFDYGGVPTSMGEGSAIEGGPSPRGSREFLKAGRLPEVVSWEVVPD
jgi:hypothetical protein